MKNLSEDLKEHATKIINFEKRKMIPLSYKENNSYKKQKVCYICKKEFNNNKNDINSFKLYHNFKLYCKYCMKNVSEELNEHAIKIINFEKREMIPLTYEENKSYKNQKKNYICKKKLLLIKRI